MNLEMLLSLMATGIGFMISLFTLIIKLSKNKKVRKTAEEMLSFTEKLSTFVEEAEKFSHYTGAEKKNFVLTKLNQFSIDNHMNFDEEWVSSKIDEVISLTNKVNASENKK
ncbi:MAG: hypothetical protein K2O05_00785, partial [Anaeroplasmataceae bacterium]|nr:hypothetical protein [Anaeroplasmataceae bacterium]